MALRRRRRQSHALNTTSPSNMATAVAETERDERIQSRVRQLEDEEAEAQRIHASRRFADRHPPNNANTRARGDDSDTDTDNYDHRSRRGGGPGHGHGRRRWNSNCTLPSCFPSFGITAPVLDSCGLGLGYGYGYGYGGGGYGYGYGGYRYGGCDGYAPAPALLCAPPPLPLALPQPLPAPFCANVYM